MNQYHTDLDSDNQASTQPASNNVVFGTVSWVTEPRLHCKHFGTGAAILGHGTGDFRNVNGSDFLKLGTREWKFSSADYFCVCKSRHG